MNQVVLVVGNIADDAHLRLVIDEIQSVSAYVSDVRVIAGAGQDRESYTEEQGRESYSTDSTPMQLAEKCADCHLFIDRNHVSGPGIAAFVHLHTGSDADEAIDDSHEARPSGLIASIATWRAYGPASMRARFVN